MFTPLKDLPQGRNWTLDELNKREVQLLIPVIIFISVTMVVGTVGNVLILYVNIIIFKVRNSTFRYFIIFLALVDIIFCLIGGPFMIGVLTHPYTFKNTVACKSLRAVTAFNVLVSAMIHSVIASDRYRRICRPYGNQFSRRWIKIIFGIITLLSFIFSIPSFILYGRNTVQTGIVNITGIQCFPDDIYKDSLFHNGYIMFLGAIFIILTTAMSVFYTLVWRQIKRHKQSMRISALFYDNEPNVNSSKMETTSAEMVSLRTKCESHNDIRDNPEEAVDPGKYRKKGNKHKDITDRAKSIRVSKMLFIVTAFFVLSFAPSLSLELLTCFDEGFIENLDNTSTMFYQFFCRTFSINFMVNPFIYGVMDRRFRMECKKLRLNRLQF